VLRPLEEIVKEMDLEEMTNALSVETQAIGKYKIEKIGLNE
jgi:hypothetical protein